MKKARWIIVLVILVVGISITINHRGGQDIILTFTPRYEEARYTMHPKQKDTLPTTNGGTCHIEVTIMHRETDQTLSHVVLIAHDLVSECSAVFQLNQVVYPMPNIIPPSISIPLGDLLIALGEHDREALNTLSFTYDLSWQILNKQGVYVESKQEKNIPCTVTIPRGSS